MAIGLDYIFQIVLPMTYHKHQDPRLLQLRLTLSFSDTSVSTLIYSLLESFKSLHFSDISLLPYHDSLDKQNVLLILFNITSINTRLDHFNFFPVVYSHF